MAQSSVLATGNWYKVAVSKDGVYKITFDQLKKMGFDPASIDPRKIKIYGNEGGMLPQANADARPTDLVENAILVKGEADGIFNSGDYILWYAEGSDLSYFDLKSQSTYYQRNLYSRENFYFITVGTTPGKRIQNKENIPGNFPIVQHFDDYVYHETDTYNELKSGREWFGERFDLTAEYSFRFSIPGILDNTPIKIVSDVMAQSLSPASMNLLFNNSSVGSQQLSTITDSQYAIKGVHQRDTLIINSSTAGAPPRSEQQLTYRFTKGSSGKSTAFLDYFVINVQRALAVYDDQTIFTTASSNENPTTTYKLGNTAGQTLVWDITDPYQPENQEFSVQSGMATFSAPSDVLRKYVACTTSLSPELIGTIENQNLHALATPDLIILSHPDFLSEAHRLAAHRQSHNNWNVVVTTPEQVYYEFSSGRQDISALRDFTKYVHDKSPGTLKALLIMGRGSYDYLDRVSNNTNFIPLYESRNSLDPLQTYSSDDYQGFLENDEGFWKEGTLPQNHTLDIGVGRLPVKTIEEAKAVVDKIIAYDTNKKNYGRWRKNIVFVADDGSNSDSFSTTHQWQANTMADDIDDTYPGFDTRKVFLGTYHKTVKPSGETIPEVNKVITEDFNRALVINYTGHGSERLWADERVFTETDIEGLENKLYPFLVTATCEFGRNDDPAQISSAEQTVIHEAGGSIGLVTTARPVYSHTNFALNQAFYDAFFQKEAGNNLTVGEIFRRTKNNSLSGVGNRNFSLLADPSLTLAMPTLNIVPTKIETSTGSDVLKSLSTVHITGEIQDESGDLQSDFTGILEATLFDKRTDFVTIGKNDPAFSFTQWHNVLFRGKATVQNGVFEFEFQMPKNIAYETGSGKLSLYASDVTRQIDAAGSTMDFSIGGSETNPPSDNTPPLITLFMGDTTFVNGGIISSSSTLIARLQDDSGINISNYGIGNNLIAILDDDAAMYVLNDYYESDMDDATSGWVHFPISNLSPGVHTLTIKAWDIYNNPAQATIEFRVTDGETLVIETFSNYPNPFQNETMLYFTHNRSGDDLEGELLIYNSLGATMASFPFTINSSPYQVNLLELNDVNGLGKKLTGGIYFARLLVRSLTDGSKNERVTKLIAVN
ncbi:MAG TPA: type IX secretion system sortase PorU [Ohtaekwangia sp.]